MNKKGPFGLWMGMTADDVGGDLKQVAPGKLLTTSVPMPHTAFESYVLQIAPRSGLSWIKAIGKTIQTSAFGCELQAAFDTMEGKLDATYGRHKRSDVLLPNSIWNEPREWTQSFLKRERVLVTQWAPEHGSTMKDAISCIGLLVAVSDTTSGYLCIEYTFENSAASDAELGGEDDQAL